MAIINELEMTIRKLATPGKGILAADESTPTITKRFQGAGIESTEDTRRTYRELLMTTPGVDNYIAGVILFEETFSQTNKQGKTIFFSSHIISEAEKLCHRVGILHQGRLAKIIERPAWSGKEGRLEELFLETIHA